MGNKNTLHVSTNEEESISKELGNFSSMPYACNIAKEITTKSQVKTLAARAKKLKLNGKARKMIANSFRNPDLRKVFLETVKQ